MMWSFVILPALAANLALGQDAPSLVLVVEPAAATLAPYEPFHYTLRLTNRGKATVEVQYEVMEQAFVNCTRQEDSVLFAASRAHRAWGGVAPKRKLAPSKDLALSDITVFGSRKFVLGSEFIFATPGTYELKARVFAAGKEIFSEPIRITVAEPSDVDRAAAEFAKKKPAARMLQGWELSEDGAETLTELLVTYPESAFAKHAERAVKEYDEYVESKRKLKEFCRAQYQSTMKTLIEQAAKEGVTLEELCRRFGSTVPKNPDDDTPRMDWFSYDSPFLCMAIGRYTGTVAVGCQNGDVKLYDDAERRGQKFHIKAHTVAVTAVAISPDGAIIAAGAINGVVKLFDDKTERELAALKAVDGAVHALAFSPDGKTLATVGADRTVKLWSLGEPGKPFAAPDRPVTVFAFGFTSATTAAVFSPDGKRLVVGADDGTIKVWTKADGQVATTTAHKSRVNSLVFSPDGKRMVSGGADGAVRLWSAAAGGKPAELTPAPAKGKPGPNAPKDAPKAAGGGGPVAVNGVTFSRDGRLIAAARQDGSVSVWDAADRRELHALAGHKGAAVAVTFSPSGKRFLAVAGADSVVRMWEFEALRP